MEVQMHQVTLEPEPEPEPEVQMVMVEMVLLHKIVLEVVEVEQVVDLPVRKHQQEMTNLVELEEIII
jgi:hypothetical protein